MLKDVHAFLSQYSEQVCIHSLMLRKVLLENLPGIIEQVDMPAKMIAYCYGQKYTEMICVIIPSQKGLKLGFYKGTELPDPDRLLKGSGKVSRYVEIKTADDIHSDALKDLLRNALTAYTIRTRK